MAKQEQVTRKHVTRRVDTDTDASVPTEAPEHARDASQAASVALRTIDDTLEDCEA